jgi:hypothetical protein
MATGPVPITTAAKTRQTLIEKTVMMQFAAASPVFDRLKIKGIGTREYKWGRVHNNVTAPDYSIIGATVPTIHSDIQQMSTIMSYFGFRVDVDFREIQDSANFENPRTLQTRLATEAEAFFAMTEFIEGDPSVSRTVTLASGLKIQVNPLPGVRYALNNQSVSGLNNLKLDAGGATVDISPAGITPTTSRALARKIDQYVRQVSNGQGEGVVMVAPFEITSAVGDIMRQGGMFKTTADSFGRMVPAWGDYNIPIIDSGLKTANSFIFDASTSANRVIGWETAGGVRDDSSNFSSFYLLDLRQTGILGIEQFGMKVSDLGLQQSDGVTYSTVAMWSLGLAYMNPNAALRAYDVKVK